MSFMLSMIVVVIAIMAVVLIPLDVTIAIIVMIVIVMSIVAITIEFIRSHKIYRPPARIVFVAELSPVSGMSRGNVQIKWLEAHRARRRHNEDRLLIDDRWRGRITDVDSAIHSRLHLTGNRDADIDVIRVRCRHA